MGDLHPEYLHVLLNPLPVYGMAAGLFLLLVSLVLRKDPAPALLWLTLMGAATWFVVRSGQQGYDRVLAMSNQEAQAWLKVHMHRAESLMYVFYATGAAALAALLARRWWPRAYRTLVWSTLALAFVSANVGGWISQAGGRVRHSEFREGPPRPDQMPPEDEHRHDETGSDHAQEGRGSHG